LLLVPYVKNQVLFGVFGATSWGGANLIAVTTANMPESERRKWVSEGKLSPYALVSVFAPPAAYQPYLGSPHSEAFPQLSSLTRPSSGAGNYNHWYFLEVNPRRRADARAYLLEKPGSYAKTVLSKTLVEVLSPSTQYAWVKQNRYATPVRIDAGQVRTFKKIAMMARKTEIVCAIRPPC
jgi:hypothetical protein